MDAERAREKLHGTLVEGRKIEVIHLPFPCEGGKKMLKERKEEMRNATAIFPPFPRVRMSLFRSDLPFREGSSMAVCVFSLL